MNKEKDLSESTIRLSPKKAINSLSQAAMNGQSMLTSC